MTSKNIVIASGSPSFIERNSTLLRRSDFRIFAAEDTESVKSIIFNNRIDLAFFDIALADATGEEISQFFTRETPSYRPVILLVCNDTEEELNRLKNCGADALITRPVKPLQLIKTVGQFLTLQLVRSRRVTLRVKVISKKEAIEFFCVSHNVSITGILIDTEYF